MKFILRATCLFAIATHAIADIPATPDVVIEGAESGAGYGLNVGFIRFDGDSYLDVYIDASGFDGGMSDQGGVIIYKGTSTGVDLNNWTALVSEQNYAGLSMSVRQAGSLNGDFYEDLVIGFPMYDNGGATDAGLVCVLYGGGSPFDETIHGPDKDWYVLGSQAYAEFGRSVGGTPFNENGGTIYSDVIVGEPYFDNGNTDEGRVLVFYGSSSDPSSSADWSVEGNYTGARLGTQLATPHDGSSFDGDSYKDFFASAPGRDENSLTDSGRVYFFAGGSSPSTTPAWTADGDSAGAMLGSSGLLYHGDGLFASSYSFDTFVGRVWFYEDDSDSASDWLTDEDDSDMDNWYGFLGAAIGGAPSGGLLAGAPGTEIDSVPGIGAAYLWNSFSSDGTYENNDWSHIDDQNDESYFGGGVAPNARDLNADSEPDFLIGNPGADEVWLYLGD